MEAREWYESFGDPDADDDLARSDDALEELFVETDSIGRFLRQERSAHVIVGSKGTGKSLLLFKKAVMTTKKTGVLIAPRPPLRAYTPALAFAGAEDWIPFFAGSLFDREGRPDRQQWAKLWLWALLTSLLRAWHRHLEAVGALDEPAGVELSSLLGAQSEDDPYSLVSGYLEEVAGGDRIVRGRPVLPEVGAMRSFLLKHVGNLPPPYLFIDNQDELFPENPKFWIAMGEGCFRALRVLHQSSGHRVHVFLTLRPEIEWELRKDPNYPKFQADIFHLRWRDAELLRVFGTRARRLNPELLASPELRQDEPIGAFLGRDLYDPKSRTYRLELPSLAAAGEVRLQNACDHLLRHTLRRPREIIILGNAILRARQDSPAPEVESGVLIREAVDAAASSVIATGYLEEVRHRWPWGEDSPAKSLKNFICTQVYRNLLSAGEVRRIERSFAEELELPVAEVDPFRRLASFGLVGWADLHPAIGETRQIFLWPGEHQVDALPGHVEWYLVHPVFYAAPFWVRPVRGLLVGPGLPCPSNDEIRRLAYYRCFMSCGKPDEELAKRLANDLREYGVDCYLYVNDAALGERIWREIKERIRVSERRIVLCSSASLIREGVKKEIEEMIDSDPDKILPLSLDRLWREPGFEVRRGGRDLKTALEARNLATITAKHKDYPEALERLLKALARPTAEVFPYRP